MKTSEKIIVLFYALIGLGLTTLEMIKSFPSGNIINLPLFIKIVIGIFCVLPILQSFYGLSKYFAKKHRKWRLKLMRAPQEKRLITKKEIKRDKLREITLSLSALLYAILILLIFDLI